MVLRHTTSVSLLISDLDNTLFDWLGMWYRAFEVLLCELETLTGFGRDALLTEVRRIHQKNGTSEYRFLIREFGSLGGQQRVAAECYRPAIEKYLSTRDRNYSLYLSVAETLLAIRNSGCAVVGYTESLRYYALRAIHRLGLDGLLNAVYSFPDHPLPEGITAEEMRTHGGHETHLSKTYSRDALPSRRKPDPEILSLIMEDFSALPSRTVYVGDSLMKDVLMAQEAGVIDVYAKYGDTRDSAAYELLRRVSHWTESDIEKEKSVYSNREVRPSHQITSFNELLQMFHFEA
jgi:phosphoglycolate phosphatase